MPLTGTELIRPMVKGVYDLQMLRMQSGLRLAANFRAKLKEHSDDAPDAAAAETEDGELSDEAKSILDQLRASYKTLTSGIARNRTLPTRKGFVGDPLINNYAELVLVHQFIKLEEEEAAEFKQLGESLEEVPIFTQYLKQQKGVGPAMAGVLVAMLDPHKARHVSSFWKYAGLDVVLVSCDHCEGTGSKDGTQCVVCNGTGQIAQGRSRREAHLVEREYINKAGKPATRKGITYEPWLKTKLFVLASSFMRANSPWADVYRNYKHRIETDPGKQKVTLADWKKRREAGQPVDHLWTPGRIDAAAKRYMLKQFLCELWTTWRRLEGLPVTPSYHEARRGYSHGSEAAE